MCHAEIKSVHALFKWVLGMDAEDNTQVKDRINRCYSDSNCEGLVISTSFHSISAAGTTAASAALCISKEILEVK